MIRLYLINSFTKLKRNISSKLLTIAGIKTADLGMQINTTQTLYPPPRKRFGSTYRIIQKSRRQLYSGNDVNRFIQNTDIQNKKLITISPGGYLGFYMMGVIAYLKTYYDLSSCVFSGSSAGAWNAILAVYNKHSEDFYHTLRETITDVNSRFKEMSIIELELHLKEVILKMYKHEDFDFSKCYIGVTQVDALQPKVTMYTDFENLSDALNCCIASSHIPFVTGKMTHKYDGVDSYDGGFSYNPNLRTMEPYLKITPDIWTKDHKQGLEAITTLFSKSKYDLVELFDYGFIDTHENRDVLDEFLEPLKPTANSNHRGNRVSFPPPRRLGGGGGGFTLPPRRNQII